MASHEDVDDDIYPEDNDSYEPQETRMQDVDDEEEGEEIESDSDDDIKFITETKDEPKAEPGSCVHHLRRACQVCTDDLPTDRRPFDPAPR